MSILGERRERSTITRIYCPKFFQVKLSKQDSDDGGEGSNKGEKSFSPFDGEGQVLHLGVLLFDLLDEVHEDVLQLRYQPGLRQTEVLVQCRCLLIPGRHTVVFA